jgi:RHS repeat-associated protein
MDASWGYSDYGKLYPTYLTNSTKHHYLYTGQEYDPEIGIYNYKARMFDPWLNIFLSPDPAMESPAAPYSYVGNDPINNVDPSGMIPVELEREILEAYKAERMTARDAEMAARIVDNPALRYKKIIKRKAFGVIPYPYLYRGRKDCFFCTLVSEMKQTNLTPQEMKQIYKDKDILKHRNFAFFYYDRPNITEIDWEAKYNMLTSQYSVLPDRANNVDELIGYLKEHPNGSKFSIGTTIEYPGTERSNGHAFKAEIFTYKDQNWVIFRDFQRGGEPKLKPLFSDRVNYTDMDAYLHKNRAGENGF